MTMKEIFSYAQNYTKQMKKLFGEKTILHFINGSQPVDHPHFHLIPIPPSSSLPSFYSPSFNLFLFFLSSYFFSKFN